MKLSNETITFLNNEIYWQIVLRQRANTRSINKCKWVLKDPTTQPDEKEYYEKLLQQFSDRKVETMKIKSEMNEFLQELRLTQGEV